MAALVTGKANRTWKHHEASGAIRVAKVPAVARDNRFFLMGSCFAQEIRAALDAELGPGQVGPDYLGLKFDPAHVSVDNIPVTNHLNTYNPFSVVQEIEGALGLWQRSDHDYWEGRKGFQCPYRRLVLADTPERLAEVCRGLDTIVKRGFVEADHFIFTFGMTEVFKNKRTGRVASQKPGYRGGAGYDETVFHRAGTAECKAAFLALSDMIAAAKPRARIFVTVSPVPLTRTFSDEDIYIANLTSKTTLRAALVEAASERENMIYFPSYDAVVSEGRSAFGEDGRHVRRDLVETITATFIRTYFGAPNATVAVQDNKRRRA